MSMSKQDFVALADALRPYAVVEPRSVSLVGHTNGQPTDLLMTVLRFCREQNQRFDSVRWVSYLRGECGPNGGKK